MSSCLRLEFGKEILSLQLIYPLPQSLAVFFFLEIMTVWAASSLSVFCSCKSTIIIRGAFSLVFITWNMEKNNFSSILLSHLVWSNQPRKLRQVFKWCSEKINCLLKQFWKRIPLPCPSFPLGDDDQFMDFCIWKLHFPNEVMIISKFWR